MATDFLTSYDYYSSRRDMEIISQIVESLKNILEEDKLQTQPLFLKTSENLILNIARKVVQEKKKTFLIGITGESASGKTVFVDNTIKACVKEKKEGIYTVIRCDDYYKDTSKELIEAGSYEALFKTGFSFDTLNEGLRDIMDVKVYVYTPLEVIKDRWYRRAALRGKTGKAADLQFQDVNKTAQQYIRPAYQISDAVINGMVSQEYIQEITDKIFYTLQKIVEY